MSTSNIRNIARIPGKLVASPTDLSSAFPHGGTELGVVRDMEFRFGIRTTEVRAEEFGRPIEYFVTAENAIFACVLRSYDNDMLGNIFHNTSDGSGSGDKVIVGSSSGSGVNRAGYPLTNKRITLLFSPYSVDHHPHILIYNAIPMLEESSALQLSLDDEFGIGIVFRVIPDEQGRDYRIGKREDLSL